MREITVSTPDGSESPSLHRQRLPKQFPDAFASQAAKPAQASEAKDDRRSLKQFALAASSSVVRSLVDLNGRIGLAAREGADNLAGRLQVVLRREPSAPAQRAQDAGPGTAISPIRSVAALSPTKLAYADLLDHGRRQTHQAGGEFVAEGELVHAPLYITSGWAARVRVMSRGRRQVLNLLLPGDGVNINRAERVSNVSVMALTTVQTIDATRVLAMASEPQRFPAIALAVQRTQLEQDAFISNQILRLGRMLPAERLANLLMEVRWRLDAVGLADGAAFPLPVDEDTLADLLAMPAKQVRKAMSSLRAKRAFEVKRGVARVISLDAAREIAEFRPPDASTSLRVRVAPHIPIS